MTEENITGNNVNIFRKISLIFLSVIFLLLSFSLNAPYYYTVILGFISLILTLILAFPLKKKIDNISLLIFLIPIASLGIIYLLSKFSSAYLSIAERIFIPFILLIFAMIGIMFPHLKKFEIKYIFAGFAGGLMIISLFNLISTLYHYGPFYGILYGTYYSYYNGEIAKDTLASVAYGLNGFNVSQITIEHYMIYPSILLTLGVVCLLFKKKTMWNIIPPIIAILIGCISLIFVISKISMFNIVLITLFNVLIIVLFLIRKHLNKSIKYIFLGVVCLGVLLFMFILVNAQINIGLHNALASNPALNYIFNTNRYIKGINLVLNNLFSSEKIIGFPVFYDEIYEASIYPSGNIIVNQFMYSGLFGFVFLIITIIIGAYYFNKVHRIKMDNKCNKYLPIMFIAIYFLYSLLSDPSITSEFEFNRFMITPFNPFFLISIMMMGYYESIASLGEKYVEE